MAWCKVVWEAGAIRSASTEAVTHATGVPAAQDLLDTASHSHGRLRRRPQAPQQDDRSSVRGAAEGGVAQAAAKSFTHALHVQHALTLQGARVVVVVCWCCGEVVVSIGVVAVFLYFFWCCGGVVVVVEMAELSVYFCCMEACCLMQLYSGLMRIDKTTHSNKNAIIRLWIHESFRWPLLTTPHHTTLHHTTPHHTTPRHTTPHFTTPHHTPPHHTTPYHTTPRHTTHTESSTTC